MEKSRIRDPVLARRQDVLPIPEHGGFTNIIVPSALQEIFLEQCCGSGIRCLFDPWIWDPGWVKNQDPDPG